MTVLRKQYNASILNGKTIFQMITRYFILPNKKTKSRYAGMMKVGDNTFPNLLALLTGLWAGQRDGTGSETEQFKKKGEPDRNINIDR